MYAFDMHTAVYLSCGPEKKDYYYASASLKKEFSELDLNACLTPKEEIEKMVSRIMLYQSGELGPPLDTDTGELRTLYNKARSVEHCKSLLPPDFNMNSVFNLLFYEGVKKNFVKFFQNDLEVIEKILTTLNEEDFGKLLEDSIQGIEKSNQLWTC